MPSSSGKHAGGDERGDLTERVAGERDGLGDVGLDGLPNDKRGEQHGELRVTRPRELLGGCGEDQVGEGLTEGGLGAVDDRPGGMIAPGSAHSGHLGALAGEHDSEQHA